MDQWGSVSLQSLALFCQKSKVEGFKITKIQTTLFLWCDILSQLNQAILFFSFVYPHQNLCTILVISSQRALESLKALIVYDGNACAIVLIKISFPTLDKNFSFHRESLLFNLSINRWNMLHLFFPTSDGSPRHFSCCLMIFTPNLCLISSCKFCGVLRLKKREVFSQFSCWPKAFSYFSKIPIKLEHSSPVALQKIRPSSAKIGVRLMVLWHMQQFPL